jgi:hypothetical protein
MRCRLVLALLSVVILAALTAQASDVWVTKDWKTWTLEDCNNILHDSPWAMTFAANSRASDGQVLQSSANARILSSLVIRQAIGRQRELLLERDPNLKPEMRRQAEQLTVACLSQSFADSFVVNVGSGFLADIKAGLEMEVSKRKYRPTQILEYDPANPCSIKGTIDLVYSRSVDGKPVFVSGDKKFVIVSPWKRDFEFNIQKMIYKGKPDF